MPKHPEHSLKISDLSRLADVPVSTLRVWSERGLLKPEVSSNGYRGYNQSHIKLAIDIKRLRKLQGLSIAAIKATLGGVPQPDGEVPDRETGSIGETVGARLRALRRARNKTIREVAGETGISSSTLASIERTSLGVKIAEAKALAEFYGVTLTSLMSDPSSEIDSGAVVMRRSGKILPTLGQGLKIEQLATGNDMMDCQRWFIEPGIDSHGFYSHEGEEFIYVLLGEFVIVIDETREHHLRQGDSIYFKSNWKHSWQNPGKTTCVILWINTPPSF